MVTTFNKKDLMEFGKFLLSKKREGLLRSSENKLSYEERFREVYHADFHNWKEGVIDPITHNNSYPEALQAIKNGHWAIRKYAYGRFIVSKYPENRLSMTELGCAVHHNYIPSFEDQMAEDWIIITDPHYFKESE